MNAQLMRISAAIIALGALLYFLACAPGGQNTDQSQNLAPNQNQANANKVALDPCVSVSDPGAKGKEIKDKIKGKMSDKLKRLLKDETNQDGTFTIEVKKAVTAMYFEAFVRGDVSGDDNLKELSNILNDFQDKSWCMRVVYFLPGANTTQPAALISGFKWSSCEYPLKTCPNGECRDDCGAMENTNTPTNSNGNSNANANRRGNTSN
jgi:hypothetical protein